MTCGEETGRKTTNRAYRTPFKTNKMKKKDQSKHGVLRLKNVELEEQLKERNQEAIQIANETGKDQAVQENTPPLLAENGIMWYRPIKSFCQESLSLIRATLQPDAPERQVNHEYYNKLEQNKRDHIETIKHDVGLAKREVQKSTDAGKHLGGLKKRKFRKVRLLCGVFVSADFFFSGSALTKIGLTFIAAYIVAFALAAAILAAAEGIPFIVEKINGRAKKIVVTIIMFSLFGVLFYWIAYLRTSGNGLYSGTPRMVFVGLNMFLLLISTFLIWRYRPTKKELEAWDEYSEVKRNCDVLEKKKENSEAELITILEEYHDKVQEAKAILILGSDLERQVEDAYFRAYSVYCESNCKYRKDSKGGAIPAFMNDDPEPLTFHFPKNNLL